MLRCGKSGKEINGTVGADGTVEADGMDGTVLADGMDGTVLADATDGIVEANATTSESGGPLGAVAIVCGGTNVPLVETGADDY